MDVTVQEKKVTKKFLPFVAGIGCGITISVLFCLGIALFVGEIQGITNRKYIQAEPITKDFSELPDDVVPEAPKVPDPDWKAKLNPAHIPPTMQQELGLKKEVFVAILGSSNSNLDLILLNEETWAKDLDANDIDYSIFSPMETFSNSNKHFVTLPETVSAEESTSQIVYHTLSHLCDAHIDTHRLFFVVGARSYVNVSGLLEFSRKIDESVSMFVGKGVLTNEEDRLYYNDVDHHCPVNPGFIITRHALQRICPHLPLCARELNQASISRRYLPSLNLARCMKRFLGLNCTSSNKFYQLTEEETVELTIYLKKSSFHQASNIISTSFPRSSSLVLNLLHRHHVERLLNETMRQNEEHLKLIDQMDKILVRREGTTEDRLVLGRKGIKNKYEHSEVIPWNRYVKNDMNEYDTVYSVDDSRSIRHLTQRDYDMLDEVKSVALQHLKNNPVPVKSGELSFGDIYYRIVPGSKMEYMLELKNSNTQIGSMRMAREFDDLVAVGTTIVENSAITIVLPIQENASDKLLPFMQMFEQSSLSSGVDMNKIALLLVIFPSSNETISHNELNIMTKNVKILDLLSSYKHKHKKLSLKWIDARTNLYSHISGISMAVSALPRSRLICSMTTSVELSTDFFYHVRANTKQGKQIFFPIPYQAPNKSEGEKDFSSSGFWRSFDFDYFCGYQSDLVLASDMGHTIGFTSGEMLYMKSISAGLNAFRAPDPSLVVQNLVHHCSSPSWSPEQQGHCLTREKQYQLASAISHH